MVDNAVTYYALSHISVKIIINRLVIVGGSVDFVLKILRVRHILAKIWTNS